MLLEIVRNDITKMNVDAIVNAANESLLGGGGVDGSIHRAAGHELLAECRTLGGCKTGKAKITRGYNLPAKYVIHAVGPIYKGGKHGEKELLESCYRESLELAKEYKCETIAFPLISSGVSGYPKDEVIKIAIDVISKFLLENEIKVYIVVFDKDSFKISGELFLDIAEYIDDNYVDEHIDDYMCMADFQADYRVRRRKFNSDFTEMCYSEDFYSEDFLYEGSLDEKLKHMEESFSQMLLRKIDEKGMTDSECYKKANIDRKLFSKIRSNVNYKPSKSTALAFAISLELTLSETEDMLRKAGFALSHSNKFDIIIEYFISSGNYNIFEINEALFAFDQNLLGA